MKWSHWMWLPTALSGVVLLRALYGVVELPAQVADVGTLVETWQLRSLETAAEIQNFFVRTSAVGAVLAGAALGAWCLLAARAVNPKWLLVVLAAGNVCDLAWNGWNFNPQCERELFYPRIAALDAISKGPPGRVIGVGCLPTNLNESHGLREVRGYDGVDPHRIAQMLHAALDPKVPWQIGQSPQKFVPKVEWNSDGTLRAPSTLSLMSVRYFIFRGRPRPGSRVFARSPDYWVAENPAAVPATYIARDVRQISDAGATLQVLASLEGDPTRTAIVTSQVDVSPDCQGTARIVAQQPQQIEIEATADRPGLLVLTDAWYPGWVAEVNGQATPIVRTNHAVRGVVVPAGKSSVVFRYEPRSFWDGLQIATQALMVVLVWALVVGTSRGTYVEFKPDEPEATPLVE